MKKNMVGWLVLSLFPVIALAVDFKTLLGNITNQLNILPAFLIGLAGIFFMYNVFVYIRSGSPKEVGEAQSMITYSIIFIFVMVSVWGLVNILVETFDLGKTDSIDIPSIPKT